MESMKVIIEGQSNNIRVMESDNTLFEPKVVREEYNKQKSIEEETESEDDNDEDWEDKLSAYGSEDDRSDFLSDEDAVESLRTLVVKDSNADYVTRNSGDEAADQHDPPAAIDATPNNATSVTEHAETLGLETHVGEWEESNKICFFNQDSVDAPTLNNLEGHVGIPPTFKYDQNEESASSINDKKSSINDKKKITGKIRPKPNLIETFNMKTPTNLNRVSDKMKILLSRNTPISEKLEQMEEKGENQQLIQYKETSSKMNDNRAQNGDRRITRSQSSKWKKKDEKVEKKDTETSWGDSISTSSSISTGVVNRLKEVGEACGFHEDKKRTKSQRHNYNNGALSGNI
ncbi:hypothetical protein L2E82_50927 [Cichorium intybus]|nr:hypothetical protein L2E82_50927 [Cichorium intybus]